MDESVSTECIAKIIVGVAIVLLILIIVYNILKYLVFYMIIQSINDIIKSPEYLSAKTQKPQIFQPVSKVQPWTYNTYNYNPVSV